MQPADMAGKMSGQPLPRDFRTATRALAEVKRLVEADVHLPGRAERRHVAQEFPGDLRRARMQGADLAAFARPAGSVAQFVQVAQSGHLDEILGVSEQVDDGHDAEAGGGRRVHEPRHLLIGISIGARDGGQARIFDRILQVQIKLLITPVGVAGQPLQKKIEPLHLAGEIPLKGFGD